jgi:hypothetical protein
MASSVAPAAIASAPRLTPLPPAAPNKVPIRDCHPSGGAGAGDFACCSEEGAKQVQQLVKNRSIAECKRIDALPRFAACPTFFARGFHTMVESCFQGALERELDRRLVPLKQADTTAFHREMALQKHFNEAVRKTCDDVLLGEQSTGDFRGTFRCTTFAIELRAKQAADINAGGLELTREPATKVVRAKQFKTFATELCALPSLWKGAPPSSCEERVMGELEDALATASRF